MNRDNPPEIGFHFVSLIRNAGTGIRHPKTGSEV